MLLWFKNESINDCGIITLKLNNEEKWSIMEKGNMYITK